MSMISNQCDNLRKRAEMADGLSPALASELRMAADTIWELRDDLQRANAENTKLREQVDRWKRLAVEQEVVHVEHERASERENAKLRELFEKTYGYYVSGELTPCDFCTKYECGEGDAPTTCKADECDPDGMARTEIERMARELGIEVDG